MASIKKLLLAVATLSTIFVMPPDAEAGCATRKAKGYSLILSVQEKSPVDYGLVTECGHNAGAFQAFKGEKMDFGWAKCLNNCEEGFIPTNLYVRVGKTFKPGSIERPDRGKTCMQQFRSATMYCLETL